jgi:hypothetical protein
VRVGGIAAVAAVAAVVSMGASAAATVPNADAKQAPPRGAAPFVVADSAERSVDPKLVAGPDGRAVAFWYDVGSEAIARRVIAADGSLGSEAYVVTDEDQIGARWVVPGRAGAALVLWRDFGMLNTKIRGRWVDSRGRLGPIREVAPAGSFGELAVSAVANARRRPVA